jgi:hypothetical protein
MPSTVQQHDVQATTSPVEVDCCDVTIGPPPSSIMFGAPPKPVCPTLPVSSSQHPPSPTIVTSRHDIFEIPIRKS